MPFAVFWGVLLGQSAPQLASDPFWAAVTNFGLAVALAVFYTITAAKREAKLADRLEILEKQFREELMRVGEEKAKLMTEMTHALQELREAIDHLVKTRGNGRQI